MYKYLIYIYLTTFLSFGIEISALPTNFPCKKITVADGLSHSDIKSITQDQFGFIWIATLNGLNIIDGDNIKIIKHDKLDSSSIASNRITYMSDPIQNNVWFLLKNNSIDICSTQTRKFRHYTTLPIKNTISIIKTSELKQLIVLPVGVFGITHKNKIVKINTDTKGNPTNIEFINDFSPQIVNNYLFVENKKELWINSGYELYKYDESKLSFLKIQLPKLPHKHINSVIQQNGKLCISYNNKAYVYDAVNNTLLDSVNTEGSVRCSFFKKDGSIWFGTAKGITVYTPTKKLIHYSIDNQLISTTINTFFEDSFKNIWIGCNGVGVRIYNQHLNKFNHIPLKYDSNNHACSNYIMCMRIIQKQIILGTSNGLSIYDLTKKHYTNYLTGHSITSINIDKQGVLYITDNYGNLISCSLKKLKIKQYKWKSNLLRYEGEPVLVKDLIIDKHHQFWFICSNKEGLFLYNQQNKNSQKIKRYSQLSKTGVKIFYEEQRDLMWISTQSQGLYQFLIQKDRIIDVKNYCYTGKKDALTSDFTYSVKRSTDNTIWVGTIGGGLCHFIDEDNEKFFNYNTSNGLPDNDVECLIIDKLGNIWQAGNKIYKLNPISNQVYDYSSYYDVHLDNGFKVGIKDKDGTLYFAGYGGIVYFDTEQLEQKENAPKLQLTNFEIQKKNTSNIKKRTIADIYSRDTIILHNNEDAFSISCTTTNPLLNNQVQYEYIFSKDSYKWIKIPIGKNSLMFNHLSPGKYNLRLRAKYINSQYSEIKNIHIIVEYNYIHVLKYILLIICIIIILIISYILTLKIKRQKSLISKVHSECEQMKADLSKEQSFFFSLGEGMRVSFHKLYAPLNTLLYDQNISEKTKDQISIAYKESRKALKASLQILNYKKLAIGKYELNYSTINLATELERIHRKFTHIAENKQIQYNYLCVEESTVATVDIFYIEQVVTRLLSDSIEQSTKNGKINLSFYTNQDNLYIELFTSFPFKLFGNNSDAKLGIIQSPLFHQIISLHNGTLINKSDNETCKYQLIIQKKLNDEYKEIAPAIKKETFNFKHEFINNQEVVLLSSGTDQENYFTSFFKDWISITVFDSITEFTTYVNKAENQILLIDETIGQKQTKQLIEKIIHEWKRKYAIIYILMRSPKTKDHISYLTIGAHDCFIKPLRMPIVVQKVYQAAVIQENRIHLNKELNFIRPRANIENQNDNFYNALIKVIESNMEKNSFSVAALSKEMGMSQTLLYKKIKNQTGKSAIEFIRSIKIKYAGELIVDTNLKFFEIAYKVGYNDVKYFSKAFKSHFGVSCSDYRKQARNYHPHDNK